MRKRNVSVAGLLLSDFYLLHASVNLIGRGKQKNWIETGLANRFEDVQRSQGIDIEILFRILHGGSHRYLRGKVENGVEWTITLDNCLHAGEIANVRLFEWKISMPLLQPGEILTCPLPGQVIEQDHLLALAQQAVGGLNSNKSCAASN